LFYFNDEFYADTGELYTWGIGPLGHKGASNPIKPKPEKVLGALENKRVISVACGREHMACVTGTPCAIHSAPPPNLAL
jgi:alpha-tubulin suppressor-like RCC1 family protein